VIRPLESRDVDAWAAMRAQLWPHADAEDLANEAYAFIEDEAASFLDAVFVAENGAALPVGFLELSIRDFADGCDTAPVPHIEGWFVEPDARGQDLGSGLMLAAEEWSRERGFTELASDTEVENVDSRSAHEACGFEETERLVKFRKVLTV
jgi:aminoglycoside 6'-N-acetyltransferase I